MPERSETDFRNTAVLGRGVKALLLAEIAVTLLGIGFEVRALSLLDEMWATDERALQIAADIARHEVTLFWIRLILFTVTGISALVWIHHMNANARALGAAGMKFTPGWAVGWYFIPIANLWMPYLAMKEIWQAHADPRDWRNVERPVLLPLWWGLWIGSILVNRIAAALGRRGETLDDFRDAAIAYIGGDLLIIALNTVFVLVVIRLSALQDRAIEELSPTARI